MEKQLLPLSHRENLVVQELNGEVLIYDLEKNKAFCLNETSALVYQLCDGTKSVSDIGKAMGEKLELPVADELVWLALDQLKKENLLDDSRKLESKFEGLSRRDVIRKVGLASLVALPVISSLVAPPAAAAQSVRAALGESCGAPDPPCCAGLTCVNGICEEDPGA